MDAGILYVAGPDLVQPGNSKQTQAQNVEFDLNIIGKTFHGMERISLVETYITCGSPDAVSDS